MRRVTIGLITVFVILLGVFIVYPFTSYHLLEKYSVSNDGTIVTSENGQVYLYDNSMALEAVSLGKRIGRTNNSGTVYEIKGQPNHDWIAFNSTDEMGITQIVHKKQVKPFEIDDKKIKQLRLVENKGLKQALGVAVASTEKTDILEELKSTIGETGKPESISSSNILSLQMLFDEYKGIAYVDFAIISEDNTVYISKFNDENLVKAGPLLSNWILKNAPKH
ncbi:MAG: hypothetical protein Q8936_16345 [Bacillota bacterium]|nr:hypothetical protein [Bacillota bacterium]